MSALGHTRTSGLGCSTVALPPKADIHCGSRNVCFVPKADITERARAIVHPQGPRDLLAPAGAAVPKPSRPI